MSDVILRPWTVEDTAFTLKVRNHPDLMKWFRQDTPLEEDKQREFILNDKEYNGQIIESNGVPVGLCGVKSTKEFTLAVLPEHQKRGIATEAMQQLIARHEGIWSDVFAANPALGWYLHKLKFYVMDIREREYYKKGFGLIDVVTIKHD